MSTELFSVKARSSPKADVVFVHGLNGDAFDTWAHDKRDTKDSWIYWLAEDHPEWAVWTLDYKADISGWQGNMGSGMAIPELAANAVHELLNHHIGERPVVFVCHSLGGLVVKYVLEKAIAHEVPSLERLGLNTRGVAFLATPHSGSALATAARALPGLALLTKQVLELEEHSTALEDLGAWYSRMAPNRGIKTLAYRENRKMKRTPVLVVNKTSADPHVADQEMATFNKDHSSIVKLASKDDRYRGVERFVTSCLAFEAERIELEDTTTRVEALSDDARVLEPASATDDADEVHGTWLSGGDQSDEISLRFLRTEGRRWEAEIGEEGLAIVMDELATLVGNGERPQLNLWFEEYSDMKQELSILDNQANLTEAMRQRRYDIRRSLDYSYSELLEERIAEIIRICATADFALYADRPEARASVANEATRLNRGTRQGKSFDMWRQFPDGTSSTKIDLTDEEVKELTVEGVFGLNAIIAGVLKPKASDLPLESIKRKVLPVLVHAYIDETLHFEIHPPFEDYFNPHGWSLGVA